MDSKTSFGTGKLEYIPISSLKVHPKIQRAFDKNWANLIGECWNPRECQPLSVVKGKINGSANGYFYVIDGQHRLDGARQHYGETDQMLPCWVYQDLTLEEQAEVVIGHNNTKSWKPIHKWNVRRVAKDPVVLAVEDLLKPFSLRVADNAGDGNIRAVAAIEGLYEKPGKEVLVQVISVLKAAWGTVSDAYDQTLLRGLCTVIAKLGMAMDHEELAKRLAKHGPPSRLIGEARQLAKISGISAGRATAEIIVNLWNKRKQEGSQLSLQ